MASLLAILLVLATRASMPARVADPSRGINSLVMMSFADSGEALIHALPPVSAAHMPLADIMAAELANHRGLSWRECRMLSGFFLAVLTVAAAMRLNPSAPFYPAVCLLVLLAVESQSVSKYMQHFYAPLVMLAACLLVWSKDTAGRFMTALGLGAGLLFRSPLAFFPPLLGLLDWIESKGPRRSWKKAMVWLVPYLFILPWAAANYAVNREFVLFEANATSPNIVGGALGLVGSTKGDWKALLDSTSVDTNSTWSVLRWALGEALTHPGRSVHGLVLRLRHVAGFHPFLLLAAAVGLWLNRRNRGILKVALLAGYFILVHSLMSVQENYFTPLWPLLSLLAASPLALISGRNRAEENGLPAELRAARGAMFACLAVALAWSLYTFFVLYCYASASGFSAQASLLSALDKHPGDHWLLARRGRMRWLQGNWSGALEDLTLADESAPGSPQRSLEIAWAKMLAGDARPLEAWTFTSNHPAENESSTEIDSMILKAFSLVRQGRPSAAARALASLVEFYQSRTAVRGDAVSGAGQALARLRTASAGVLAQRMPHLILDFIPLAERPAFCIALTKIFPLQLHLSKDEFLGLLGADYNLSASLRQDFRRTLPLLYNLTALYPRETMLWIELADAAVHGGQWDIAREALRKTEKLSPNGREQIRIAGAYSRLQERRRALDMLERHIAGGGRDPILWIGEARLVLKSGQKELALRLMEAASGLALKDDLRHELALLYEECGERGTALRLLKDLVRKHPANALYRKDLGVCAFRLRDIEEARSNLEESIRLDPSLLEARLSLGAVHMADNDPEGALKIYDLALSHSGLNHPLRHALQEARALALRQSR